MPLRNPLKESIKIDKKRDENLTAFGKTTLQDRYLLDGEDYQTMFKRVASSYSDNDAHASRLYDYFSKLWAMPATPVLSNGGTTRGLPISCYLNEVGDSLDDIVATWNENVWLVSRGGGIGTYYGNVRSIGEKVGHNGKTSGPIPFIVVQDALILAISQGSLRRGSSAIYMPIDHPEIEDFIEIRRPTGGDPNRKALNIHHGVVITDKFMEAVENGTDWDLISPHTKEIISTVKARDIWVRLLTTRIETGEPYMLFIDTVNKHIPEHHKKLGLKVKTSNLCAEITLPTGKDHLGNERTAVCCLSSINLEKYDEWKDDENFIEDMMRFLDNVLQDFIDNAPESMKNAKYSAMRERSIGLGVMGFHSFLQSKMIPLESALAKSWNKKIFKQIKEQADKASKKLAKEKGPCPDAEEVGVMERFSNKIAVAPNASISNICGETSPGIEPYRANVFVQKTLSGSFTVKNKHLKKLLASRGLDTERIWSSIAINEGSVQHLDCLTEDEKAVFKTATEIDQRWLIEFAADRTPYICQSQSLNLFMPGDIHKRDLHNIHFLAWKKGIKSIYYGRSTSIQRSDKVSHKEEAFKMEDLLNTEKILEEKLDINTDDKYDECLACQ